MVPGFSPQLVGPIAFGCHKAEYHEEFMVEQIRSPHDQEAEREEKKGQGPTIPSEGQPPMT